MSSIKCPNCGLIDFATATECKRCKQSLEARSYPYWNGNSPVELPTPDWSKLQTVPAIPGEYLADYGDGSHTIGNILFAIYLALNVAGIFYGLNSITSESTLKAFKLATAPKSRLYLASFEVLYYVAWSGIVIFLPAALILIMTLFRKAKAFLGLVKIYLITKMIYSALQAWLIFRLEVDLREKNIPPLELAADQIHWIAYMSMIGILLTFIWFRYYTTSKRARFVFA